MSGGGASLAWGSDYRLPRSSVRKAETVEYQDFFEGCRLSVWTSHSGVGWKWAHAIDDQAMVQSPVISTAPERMVLGEGIDQARRAVQLARASSNSP